MDKIIVLMGETATGKTYLLNELMKINPTLKKVVTYTDRPIRKGEVNGEDYWFMSKEEMSKMINSKDMLEYAKYNVINKGLDVFTYGTHKNSFQDDSNNLICVLDYEGFKKVRNMYPNRVLGFEINLDRETRMKNYVDRGGEIEEFLRREKDDKSKFIGCSKDDDIWHISNKIGKGEEIAKVMNLMIDFYSRL